MEKETSLGKWFRGAQLESFDYRTYWKGRGTELRSKLLEREHIFLSWIKDGSRVLDVACGNSRLLYELMTKKNCEVLACDVDAEVLQTQENSGVQTRLFDLNNGSLSLDEHFDVIVASEILEHLSRSEDVLCAISQHAEYVAISVPNSAFYRFRFELALQGKFFKQWVHHPAEHLRFWSHTDFCEWLKVLGFEIVKTEVSNGFDIFGFRFYKYFPNLFGHQICYLVKNQNIPQ